MPLMLAEPPCEAEGCGRPGTPYVLENDPPFLEGEPSYWAYHYCGEHAQAGGFCWGCGGFWGGVEDFDFSCSGLCINCDWDFDDPEDDEECDYSYEAESA